MNVRGWGMNKWEDTGQWLQKPHSNDCSLAATFHMNGVRCFDFLFYSEKFSLTEKLK